MAATAPICLVNDTRNDLHHGCSSVVAAIERECDRVGLQIISRVVAHADWRADSEFMSAIENARCVIVNGEGSIHHNRAQGRRLLEVGGFASSLGVPAALINCGWEANSADFSALLESFEIVSFRDSFSAQQSQLPADRWRVVPDLSLTTPADAAERTNRIEFTDSVDRRVALQLDRLRASMHGGTLSILYSGCGPFGPLQFVRNGIARQDVLRPAALANHLQVRARLLRNSSSQLDWFKSRLSSASLLVTGRFHAASLALATNTPFVAAPSNTRKIQSLVQDAGIDPGRVPDTLDQRAIHHFAHTGWGPTEQDAAEYFVESAKRGATNLFDDIAELAACK